jgi:hypothetical protein
MRYDSEPDFNNMSDGGDAITRSIDVGSKDKKLKRPP